MRSSSRSGHRVRLSRHLSFFRRADEVYLYHDLWGFLLQMDRRVYDFIRAFGAAGEKGARVEDVTPAFRKHLRPEEVEGFVATLRSHRCLVAPRADEEAAVADGYPVRAPWTVWYATPRADEVILAYKDRRLRRVSLERLGRIESRFFKACEGEKSVAEIVEKLAKDAPQGEDAAAEVADRVHRLLFRLTHSDRQVLKLAERPLFTYLQFTPPYLRSTVPFPRIEEGDDAEPTERTSADEVVDLGAYHRRRIADAHQQFDIEETTLSHMFREPHPAFGGRTYGGAFADEALARGALAHAGTGTAAAGTGTERRLEAVEVGGGVGFFGLCFLRRLDELAPAVARRLRYTIVDLSRVLQDSQRLLNSALGAGRVRYVLANASRSLPFADASLDLVISNEVIADLETVRLRRAEIEGHGKARARGAVAEAYALVRRHALPVEDAPEVFWLNFGALRLVEELGRVLRPGGAAFLVEFGGEDRYPVESTHLDHSEFSIHFGHVRHVAARAGLEVEIVDVLDFLKANGRVRVLSTTRSSFEALRSLLQRRGVQFQKLAYTDEQWKALIGDRLDLAGLHGADFKPVAHRALGLAPREFKVAVLRRPPAT